MLSLSLNGYGMTLNLQINRKKRSETKVVCFTALFIRYTGLFRNSSEFCNCNGCGNSDIKAFC